MASNPTSPNHSSSSSESDPDSTAAGGLRLEVPEIPAHRLKTYATLPLPVQVAPKHEAIDQPSIFQDSDPIVQFVNSLGGLSNDDEFNAKLRIWVCSPGDRPWLHKPDGDVKRSHFFFAYEYMFSELGIRLPFSPFVQTVLRDINAAPCQLHPNAWAFIRCFEILSAAVGIAPSPTSFFYLYDVDSKSIKNKGWISLKARAGRKCLHPHKSNAKSSFARKYFRVAVHPAYPEAFTLRDGTALFPLYWTEKPNGITDPSEESLSANDKAFLDLLAPLPILDCTTVLEGADLSRTPKYLEDMNFTNAELLKARERRMARFSPKFNTEGDAKKRGGAENQAESTKAPKRRRLTKTSSGAGTSNPGAQPTTAAAPKGKNVAEASIAAATEPTAVPASTPASAGATAAVAAESSVGATAASAGVNATKAAASSDTPIGEKEKENETPKSPPHQEAPPSPPPTRDAGSMPSPPHQGEKSCPGAATTSEAAQIEQAPAPEVGSSSYYNMLPNAIEPSEFLLAGLNRDVIEKEVLSRGLNDTKEETLACLLRAGCIFAHTFEKFNAANVEAERLKAESAKHQEAAAAWEKRFDKLATQAGKDKVYADKMIGTAGIKIGELEDQLALMKEEADELDASLQACKKEKEQVEKDLIARGEALIAKESELAVLCAELELVKKALAEQEKKSAESLALAKSDMEAVMQATSEEIKKATETHAEALATKDAEIASQLAKIKSLEDELATEKAKAIEAREQAADIALDNRERGFYLAKDQAQHLYPNFDFSAMGVMKEITTAGLVGPDDPPLIDQNLWTATEEEEEEEEQEKENNE
ncbi:uncharacterized protein LOC130712265 [Lotus japonicus]|uniref:uncharacterized protein LOC130712265 n=1 Tax=Lotus japonicus TaxID=34305 RepID=UPI0025869BA7|nr:uncharacterized protein LOC130712265 [Lotus japonicus]